MPNVITSCVESSEVVSSCLTPVETSAVCLVSAPIIPDPAFTVEFFVNDVWVAVENLGSVDLGELLFSATPLSVPFRITNTGNISLSLLFSLVENAFFSYNSPSSSTSLLLSSSDVYLGSFNALKSTVGSGSTVFSLSGVLDYSASFASSVAYELPTNGSLFKASVSNTNGNFPTKVSFVFTDFTVEFWVKTLSTPAPNQFGRYIDNSFSNGFAINFQATRKIVMEGNTAGLALASDNNTIIFDTWEHYAFRRQGTALRLFKNGTLIKSGTSSGVALNLFNAPLVRFGSSTGGEHLASFSSDMRFWNYARSDAEISANYNKRLTGFESGLVWYYPLAEATNVFRDWSGNNPNLSLLSNGSPGPTSEIRYDVDSPTFINT